MSIWVFVIIFLVMFIGFWTETISENFSPFINFDLCDKPHASHAPFPIYQWWKSGPHVEKYRSCDQYRCRTDELNGYTAQPGPIRNQHHYIDPSARSSFGQ